jgi:hypothetical protein
MRAIYADDSRNAVAGSEGDEILSQQADSTRGGIPGELFRVCRGNPELAEQSAHRRAGADSSQQFIVLERKHDATPYGYLNPS